MNLLIVLVPTRNLVHKRVSRPQRETEVHGQCLYCTKGAGFASADCHNCLGLSHKRLASTEVKIWLSCTSGIKTSQTPRASSDSSKSAA